MDNRQDPAGKECTRRQMVLPSVLNNVLSALILSCRIDDGEDVLRKAFESGKGLDKDRCMVTKDLNIVSIAVL